MVNVYGSKFGEIAQIMTGQCMSLNRILAVASAIWLLGCSNAFADGSLVTNYGQWRSLSQPLKIAYLSGSFDQLMLGLYSDSLANKVAGAEYLGIFDCVQTKGITTSIFVEMVDQRYLNHSNEWGFGPSAELNAAILDICKPQINEERRKFHLEPMSNG